MTCLSVIDLRASSSPSDLFTLWYSGEKEEEGSKIGVDAERGDATSAVRPARQPASSQM